MSATSSIEWTEATWNPVTGCTKVSPGCDHCYAETFAERFRGVPGHHFERGFDVQLRPEKMDLPLRWRKPRRIFVNSMSDLFHEGVPDEFVAQVFAVMAMARAHTFQLLTKRHGRMKSLLSSDRFPSIVGAQAHRMRLFNGGSGGYMGAATEAESSRRLIAHGWPLPNVWLGVSAEDQKWANLRVPALIATPAAVRWVSAEPLLGPIDLAGATRDQRYACHACEFGPTGDDCNVHRVERLDWIVVGGESGPSARPMSPAWARSLRDQCDAAGTPFLFKQWGAHDATGKRGSKKASGRELDGHIHDGYPGVAS